jgi:hypothetical protein
MAHIHPPYATLVTIFICEELYARVVTLLVHEVLDYLQTQRYSLLFVAINLSGLTDFADSVLYLTE